MPFNRFLFCSNIFSLAQEFQAHFTSWLYYLIMLLFKVIKGLGTRLQWEKGKQSFKENRHDSLYRIIIWNKFIHCNKFGKSDLNFIKMTYKRIDFSSLQWLYIHLSFWSHDPPQYLDSRITSYNKELKLACFWDVDSNCERTFCTLGPYLPDFYTTHL